MPVRASGAEDEAMSDSSPTPTPRAGDNAETSNQRRDRANREKYAIRRLFRDMKDEQRTLEQKMRAFGAAQKDAKDTIERDSRFVHWGHEPERPWAWRGSSPDTERQGTDHGPAATDCPTRLTPTARGSDRVSWQVLGHGADVISADGVRVGAVEYVLADMRSDIFDGVVIDTRLGPGGRRFVDARQIALIFEDRIVLSVSTLQVDEFPAPTENPGALEHHATDPMPSALGRQIRKGRKRLSGH
jgi:hypothetical protein